MRIALLSTCSVPVPPPAYGGTELVVAELAKNLTRLGHDVTVYATGDSRPTGRLQYRFDHAVWPPDERAELQHAEFAWRHICAHDPPFDLVHAHQSQAVALASRCRVPLVLTIHHARDERLLASYLEHPARYVAISRRQAELSPELGIRDVVHHGVDPALYPAGAGAGGYLAFLGRLAREKAPHVAIDAALAAGLPLRIGGRPHEPDHAYFAREVKPRLDRAGARIEWLGEVRHPAKLELLSGARALLVPIEWEEPFGLVLIEAMLIGTPVIAFARGSAPEIVEDGVTGFIVRSASEMTARIGDLGRIDRARCRARATERWSALRMARDYEQIYRDVVRGRAAAAPQATLEQTA